MKVFQEMIWLDEFVDKLRCKHGVEPEEIEQMVVRKPRVRRVQSGDVAGEDVYAVMGQSAAGRYLIAFVIDKGSGTGLVISGRDMTRKEKRRYAQRQR